MATEFPPHAPNEPPHKVLMVSDEWRAVILRAFSYLWDETDDMPDETLTDHLLQLQRIVVDA